MKDLLKGRILLLIIFVLGAGALYLANINVGYLTKINAIQTELAESKKQTSELEKKSSETEAGLRSEIAEIGSKLETADMRLETMPQLQESEVQQLKEKGLKDPEKDLKLDLMKRQDLIPYKAVLGGEMGVYSEANIHIISAKWAAAYFDDGHINGIMLLKYNIQKDGKIRWYVMDSFLYQ
ncbi:MAG: hypothetical protein K0S75_1265 [Clostridia bacterium]|jgi:hypothetical protein|nr:hypothetical protein [Clostridia bacterium]